MPFPNTGTLRITDGKKIVCAASSMHVCLSVCGKFSVQHFPNGSLLLKVIVSKTNGHLRHMTTSAPPIFDGHNDVLLQLHEAGGVKAVDEFMSGLPGAVDLPKAKAGGFGGGFFAAFVPSPMDLGGSILDQMVQPAYDLPLPDPVDSATALDVVMRQAATLMQLEQKNALKICRTVTDLEHCFATDTLAAIFHMEGAEAIDEDLCTLDVLHQAGLRSLGPVWSRPTIFAHGVPFRFPSTPDIGPGLTDAGLRLVKRCNELRIMIDLSHLNEAGFWDVAKTSTVPLVATHSNAHAITPHARNLTDRQLAAVADSDGMVGVNFAVAFLREDGRMIPEVHLEQMMRHIDHLIGILGEDRVGFGSDYDGAIVPPDIKTIADLGNLRGSLVAHGFDAPLIEKLCYRNWFRVLEATWGA